MTVGTTCTCFNYFPSIKFWPAYPSTSRGSLLINYTDDEPREMSVKIRGDQPIGWRGTPKLGRTLTLLYRLLQLDVMQTTGNLLTYFKASDSIDCNVTCPVRRGVDIFFYHNVWWTNDLFLYLWRARHTHTHKYYVLEKYLEI